MPTPEPPRPRPVGRRAALRAGLTAAGAAGLVAARASGTTAGDAAGPFDVPDWTRSLGRPVVSQPYGQPSPFEKDVVRRTVNPPPREAASSLTPLQDLHGIVTPNGLVYERHHAGVAEIDPGRHRLVLHGLVDRPLSLTLDDLLRFPSVSRLHFLECSGNGASEWEKPVRRTVQETHGLLSCCEWTGVPLAVLLQEAGFRPEARWLLAEGADGAAMSRSVPIEKALDDALVVYAQNGEALRPEQGYPVRLLLPGWEGNISIKWLRRIKLGTEPFETREETSKYTDLMPDGTARQFTFVMEAKSVITRPSGGHRLVPGFHEVRGLAWSGRGRVTGVEVSTDGGRSWQRAALQEPVLSKCLTGFRLPWVWDGTPALLQSRATDDTGYVQPRRDQLLAARGNNSYYHFNAIQTWAVAPSGEVSNAAA